MKWRGNIYIDHCIPFGLCSAPKLFNIMADLLAWIMEDSGVSYLIHYLDDYLTMGPPGSTVCQQNLNTFTSICADLGVPLTADKLEGPSTLLCFLGIILDTEHMEIRLPADKLARIKQLLISWLPSQEEANLVTCRYSPPCYKSSPSGKSICCKDVFYSSKTTQDAFCHKIEHIIQIRSVVVAYFPSGLEWFQYSQTSCSITSSGLDPNRHFRSMGLCSSDEFTLAAVAMAFRMVQYWNHG